MQLVIVTDLDGTLLDSRTYGFGPAIRTLERVKRLSVPVVLCSSKTRAEIEAIRLRIGIDDPFIPENGGAIVARAGYFARRPPGAVVAHRRFTLELGRPYGEVVAILKDVAAAERVRVIGFSDMTVGEVAEDCGLSPLDAQLAKLRQYDEPFRLPDADQDARHRLVRALRRRGVSVVAGGRYDHAMGDNSDKGRAVTALRAMYGERGDGVVMVGLGDSSNDIPMLRAVEYPVIVRNGTAEAATRLARDVPAATVTQAPGPEGWAEAITTLLDQLRPDRVRLQAASGRARLL
jgi:mannosyl-3-phosphoglycerate phosphatase family protein